MHCAEVRRSKHRLWMRLVGLRHDVQLWDRDRRAPQNPFVRPYAPLFTNAQIAAGLAGAAGAVSSAVAAAGAAGLRGAERWISERLDPVVAGPAAEYLQGVELFMPLATVDGPVARLAGFAKLPEDPGGAGDRAWGFEPGARGDGEMGDVTGATDPEKKKTTGKEETDGVKNRVGALTEVVVLRDPPLVQVYRVESYGRRFRRALVFASQAAWCLADIDPDGHPALSDSGERYLLSAARLGAAASSLVVSRHLNENQGRQQFVPARHLRGLLPAALLEEYAFWQSGDGDLYGDAKHNAKHPRTMIHCRLLESDGDGTGVAGERAAVIRRIPLPPGCEPGTSVRVPEGVVPGQLTLVDLLYAPAILAAPDAKRDGDGDDAKTSRDAVAEAATALKSLAGRLAAVEGLAHCLAWTAAPVDVDKLSRQGGVLGALRGRRRRRRGRDGGGDGDEARRRGGSAASFSRLVRLRDRPPRVASSGHLLQPRRLEEARFCFFVSRSRRRERKRARRRIAHAEAGMRGARRFVFVRAAFARAGRASLRFAARARAGGARRRLESASARRRRAAPGAGPRRRGFGGRFFRRRRETKTLHSEGPGGGGRGGGCRGGHQGVRHRHRARPLGPRVDQKRKRVWRRSLRVPGAQLARRARGDQPRRGALPVFASVPGAPLRGRVQTRGPVRERVAPDAGGGAALVGVRRRRARSGAGRVRGAVASVGGGVRDARRELLCWDVEPELVSYVATWRHVGAACRLPANEERELLDSCSQEALKSPLLANRASYLYLRSRVDERVAVGHPDAPPDVSVLTTSQNGASTAACPLVYPDLPPHSVFDLVDDRSCLEEGVTGDGPLGKLAGLTHSFTQYEAKDVTGAAGLQKVGEWLDAAGGAFFAGLGVRVPDVVRAAHGLDTPARASHGRPAQVGMRVVALRPAGTRHATRHAHVDVARVGLLQARRRGGAQG